MQLDEFEKIPRGPSLFDCWVHNAAVRTSIGDLPVELITDMDAQPSEAVVQAVTELAEWARSNESHILDLIYGHYRYYELNDWLNFWGVPSELKRDEILEQISAISIAGDEENLASIFVDPKWGPEHKLDLTYRGGSIVAANDQSFRLEDGVLYLG